MDIQQEMLLDGAHAVLVDKKLLVRLLRFCRIKKSVERNGDSIEGVMSVVDLFWTLRGKSLDVRFCKALKDVDGNVVSMKVSCWRLVA